MNWTEGTLARHSRGRARNAALIARQKQHYAKARANLLNNRSQQHPITISFLPHAISASPQHDDLSRGYRDEQPIPVRPSQAQSERESLTYAHENVHRTAYADDEKRRRLLEKSDWAGLHLQEPLNISFPGQIYATSRWTRPCGIAPKKYERPAAVRRDKPREPLKQPSMRIRIGSQEIQPSHTTGSQSGVKRHPQESNQYVQVSHQNFGLENCPQTQYYNVEHASHGPNAVSCDTFQPLLLSSSSGPETPINVVYSSSVIHEPVPRRDSKLPLLQWSSLGSDYDDSDRQSMQVEVEQPTRPVPSSQESEQRLWEIWPPEKVDPGIPPSSVLSTDSGSNITLPTHLQLRLPSLDLHGEDHDPAKQSVVASTSTGNIIEGADLPTENKSLMKNAHASQGHPDLSDDLNAIWMKFAYGDDLDSEELVMNAMEEAVHQAAVELRPSEPSEASGSGGDDTGIVETGDAHAYGGDGGFSSDVGFFKSSLESYAATQGTEQSFVDDQDTSGMTLSPTDSSTQSHMATQGTAASDLLSSNMSLVEPSDAPNSARFTMPKPFVGKRAGTDKSASQGMHFADSSGRVDRGRRKRRKRRATDGRPDIRNLPDFDKDPIEEIEDD